MSYRIVIDYGTHCDYVPFQSEWAANLMCSEYNIRAKLNGINAKCHVEKGRYINHVFTPES